MKLAQASIWYPNCSRLKRCRATLLPSLTIYEDSATQRTVQELRFFADSAALETRTLFDFDGKCWATYGEARNQTLTIKEARAIEATWLARIRADLVRDDRNASYKAESYFPTLLK